MTIEILAQAGGLFAVLTFIHFVGDWVFQSHEVAMRKSKEPGVRATHCLSYAMFFMPLLAWMGMSWLNMGICFAVLFGSHFIEDTYIPVLLWAKYMRKPPEFTGLQAQRDKLASISKETGVDITLPDEEMAFRHFVKTPLGILLMIAIDQIIHLTFLWVPVFFLLKG